MHGHDAALDDGGLVVAGDDRRDAGRLAARRNALVEGQEKSGGDVDDGVAGHLEQDHEPEQGNEALPALGSQIGEAIAQYLPHGARSWSQG